jgi:hypothetical protein
MSNEETKVGQDKELEEKKPVKKRRSFIIRASGVGVHMDIVSKLWRKVPQRPKEEAMKNPITLGEHFNVLMHAADVVVKTKGPTWAQRQFFSVRLGSILLLVIGFSIPAILFFLAGYRFLHHIQSIQRSPSIVQPQP